MKNLILITCLCLTIGGLQGCASRYVTPAGGVDIAAITDEEIADLIKVQPASGFPARLAVARVQAPGYYSRTNSSYGQGRYSVVTTRDIEDEAEFKALADLPMLNGIAPLARVLLPAQLESLKDLRRAAARLKTDVLLIYSVDTSFNVEGTPLGPLSLITLGFIPNKEASVRATTSGALIDVRTGYVYGVAEATARQQQRATVWNTNEAIDEARLVAEKQSFKAFMREFEQLWRATVEQYAPSSTR